MQGTLAVISDIHGNVDALRAVLDDIKAQGIERIVNLGDHLSGPLAAAETTDLLMTSKVICIRGIHDRALVDQDPDRMGAWDLAAHAQLGPHHMEWLKDLPPVLSLPEGILLCHGTPLSDTTYWLETVLPRGHVILKEEALISKELEGSASLAQVIAGPVAADHVQHQNRILGHVCGRFLQHRQKSRVRAVFGLARFG